jgi:aldehyde:ferredoxin oxidoreductase
MGHGFFGARLRQAGWDGIVLRGRAEAPVYLAIDDDRVELHPAGELWGLDTFETQRQLLAETSGSTRSSQPMIFQVGKS